MLGINKLLTVMEIGGWVILPLILASIITLALIFEQFWYLFLSGRRLLKLQQSPANIGRIKGMDIVSRMVYWLQHHPTAREEEQKIGLQQIYNHFERRINWLNTLAAIAPLLGLLGTVFGMIRIFSIVAVQKPTDPLASLSGGISEALFATAGGLFVAILAALAYHHLQARLERTGEQVKNWYRHYQEQKHIFDVD